MLVIALLLLGSMPDGSLGETHLARLSDLDTENIDEILSTPHGELLLVEAARTCRELSA